MKKMWYKHVFTLTLVVLGISCYVVIFSSGCNRTEQNSVSIDSVSRDTVAMDTLEPPIIPVDSLLGTWWCCMNGDLRSAQHQNSISKQSRTMVNLTFVNDSVIKFDIGSNYNAGELGYCISGNKFLFNSVLSDTQNEEYYDLHGYDRKLSGSSSFSYVNGHLHIDSIPTIPVYRDLTFTRFDTTHRYATPQEYLGEWIYNMEYYTGDCIYYSCTITEDTILFSDYPWLDSAYYYCLCADTVIYLKRWRGNDITYMYLNQDSNLVIGGIFPPITIALLQSYVEIKLRRP